MSDEKKLAEQKKLKKAVKGYMRPKKEKSEYYIISNPHWNGGKGYRVKITSAKAQRLSYKGYKVTKDWMQTPSVDKDSAMSHHKRLF